MTRVKLGGGVDTNVMRYDKSSRERRIPWEASIKSERANGQLSLCTPYNFATIRCTAAI